MGRRLDLHSTLVSLLGSPNVYFQPPATIQMKYPCIVYERVTDQSKFADNKLYLSKRQYTVTVIDPNPDTDISDRIKGLPLCKLNTVYTVDNLNHYPHTLYY